MAATNASLGFAPRSTTSEEFAGVISESFCMSSAPAMLADVTQGSRVWLRTLPSASAQLVMYQPRFEMPRHSHRTASITVVLAGSFEESSDEGECRFEPLSVVVKPAGAIHATRVGDHGMRTLVLEVHEAIEDRVRRYSGLFDACQKFPPCGDLGREVVQLCRMLCAGRPMTSDDVDRWFRRFSGLAGRASSGRTALRMAQGIHVQRALRLLNQERSMTTAELAGRLRLHPVYLARLFRQRLGCSPAQVRQRLRTSAAVDAIVRSRLPLARVAMETGFADQSHMSRHIRRSTGITANALRHIGAARD